MIMKFIISHQTLYLPIILKSSQPLHLRPDITRVNENPNKEQASIFTSKPKPGRMFSFYFSYLT